MSHIFVPHRSSPKSPEESPTRRQSSSLPTTSIAPSLPPPPHKSRPKDPRLEAIKATALASPTSSSSGPSETSHNYSLAPDTSITFVDPNPSANVNWNTRKCKYNGYCPLPSSQPLVTTQEIEYYLYHKDRLLRDNGNGSYLPNIQHLNKTLVRDLRIHPSELLNIAMGHSIIYQPPTDLPSLK